MTNCLLCQSSNIGAFQVHKKPEKAYYHCDACDFIFMNPSDRLSAMEEKARYDLHTEAGSDGHRAFLQPLVDVVTKHLENLKIEKSQLKVLDYGCGPQAFLSGLFNIKEIPVLNYDLFYFPDQDAFRKNYHAITATEVWEHLYNPREEIVRLASILKPGGILAVMTSGHKGEGAFHDWHYRRDLTHVSFFSEKTMRTIAAETGLTLIKAQSPFWYFVK
jgi:hypothetical protein